MTTSSGPVQAAIKDIVLATISCAYARQITTFQDTVDDQVELPAGTTARQLRVAAALGGIQQFCADTGYIYDASEFKRETDFILYLAALVPWHLAAFYKPGRSKLYDYKARWTSDKGVEVVVTMAYDWYCEDMKKLFGSALILRSQTPVLSKNAMAIRAAVTKSFVHLAYGRKGR